METKKNAKEKKLDLGIGRGGSYLNRVTEGTVVIGIDVLFYELKELLKKYGKGGIRALQANVEEGLPFRSSSIDEIFSLLPDGGLLDGFKGGFPLWDELFRVLKPGGRVVIIGEEMSWRDDYHHSNKIKEAAKEGGFVITVFKDLEPNDVRSYGSVFSNSLTDNPIEVKLVGREFFKILAIKPSDQ